MTFALTWTLVVWSAAGMVLALSAAVRTPHWNNDPRLWLSLACTAVTAHLFALHAFGVL